MPSSEEEAAALGRSEFWDKRYAKAEGDKPTHEWFRSFDALKPFFEKHLFEKRGKEERVLHLGSGDSSIPYDLLARGYTNQLCLDFSTVVVDLMRTRHPAIFWKLADVRNMSDIATRSIDVAFDKGTLDAMIYGSPWSPPDEVLRNSGLYMDEVWRVLKDDGVFLYITYRQPHFIKPILNRGGEWDLDMEVMGGGDSFQYFGFVLRKHIEGGSGSKG
ncbi:hypothetical protein BDW02DRAFT_524120 [Decorospora gaudefroyi]|uniref:Uncharacterized protein n=1 Tax=Decorospora gaudefroyi TaxID=184978 RepID=A0A6A5KCF0_9PLEO|nr:hypothetical protein BDW02DRAFT_524120 [Decorospora gaudefroyi]